VSRQSDGQKFIGQSRAPRVQIEYDVELYGSQKKVELPFVVGVMSDLSGDNSEGLGPIEDRRFVDIDVDNFDRRMEQIAPALSYHVPNVLAGDGTLVGVDLSFKRLADFEPAELVKRIPELAVLLDARTRLMELATYMDGKAAAEDVVKELLSNPRWVDAVKLTETPPDGLTPSGLVAAPEKDLL
jgi:type VI secretion system protein ImpB